MDDPRDAEDATRELDGSRMCGRRVKVRLGQLLDTPPFKGSQELFSGMMDTQRELTIFSRTLL